MDKPLTTDPDIRELRRRAASRTPFAVELIARVRERAEAAAELNSLAWTDWDGAHRQAEQRDASIRNGEPQPALAGVPVSVKDLYSVRGTVMKAGTRSALPDLGTDDALAVRRLRDAGAIIFGKTNLHEVALGATGENAWTGDVKNPFDTARQAGGSSSGAGVCVARGIGHVGLGSDTGGSIRIPANFCGVVGFKPSFGSVPLTGALHLSWTCDHGGPLTRSVGDARLVFEVLSRRRCDHAQPNSAPRLAIPRRWLASRLSTEVAQCFERALTALASAGAQLCDVETPQLPKAWLCYTPIVRAEAAYVHRASLAAGGVGFSDAVLAPLRAGEKITALEYFEAMRLRDEVSAELRALTRSHDALLLPSACVVPPLRGQTEVEVSGGAMSVREAVLGQTLPFNLAGVPALTLPMGSHNGLPIGLQVVGDFDADARLLSLGEWIESRLAGRD